MRQPTGLIKCFDGRSGPAGPVPASYEGVAGSQWDRDPVRMRDELDGTPAEKDNLTGFNTYKVA